MAGITQLGSGSRYPNPALRGSDAVPPLGMCEGNRRPAGNELCPHRKLKQKGAKPPTAAYNSYWYFLDSLLYLSSPF